MTNFRFFGIDEKSFYMWSIDSIVVIFLANICAAINANDEKNENIQNIVNSEIQRQLGDLELQLDKIIDQKFRNLINLWETGSK